MEVKKCEKQLVVGDLVIFFDQFGLEHNALLTAVFGDRTVTSFKEEGSDTVTETICNPCVNILIVSPDERRDDSYGRQVERMTSVVHGNGQTAWGNFYCLPNEVKQAQEKCAKAKNGEFGVGNY